MKQIGLILSISGLVLTLLPAIMVFQAMISPAENHRLMGIGLLLYVVGRFLSGTRQS